MSEIPDLSIVIPVYNEGRKVDRDIRMAAHFLQENHIRGEILLSDDGSQDDTLDIPAEVSIDLGTPLKILRANSHFGKGYAVRSGILQALGKIVLFVDSGSCIPWHDILPGIEMVRSGDCDIAHGSRFLPGSVITRKKQWYRRILSSSFRRFIRQWMDIPRHLSDTQCGMKIYTAPVAKTLYKPCISEGFMFDIEIILRACQAGFRIKEFPVTWTADPDSRLRVFQTLLSIFPDLGRIRNLHLH